MRTILPSLAARLRALDLLVHPRGSRRGGRDGARTGDELASLDAELRIAAARMVVDPSTFDAGRRAALAAFARVQAGWSRQGGEHRLRLPGRLAAIPLVTALLAGTGSVALAAAAPGRPFYGAWITVEQAAMAGIDPGQNPSGEADWLDLRLDEAEGAAARNDTQALGAALDAYSGGLDQLRRGVAPRMPQRPVLAARLDAQVDRLAALAVHVREGSVRDDVAQKVGTALQRAREARGPLERRTTCLVPPRHPACREGP